MSGRRSTRVRARTVVAALLVLLVVGPTSMSQDPDTAGAEPVTRPNIVVIYTDDHAVGQMFALERTQALIGDEGLTFTDSVVSYPLCCPSRATLFTGQYTQNNGVRSNAPAGNDNPLPEALPGTAEGATGAEIESWAAFRPAEASSLAVALDRAGYHTAMLGKYLNGYEGTTVPPGWDDWRVSVAETQADYLQTRLNVNGQIVDHPDRYKTDLYADLAEEMITEAAASGDPFLLVTSLTAPHGGANMVPERHADAFPGAQAPRGPAFDADNSAKPGFIRNRYPELTPAQIQAIDSRWRRELQALLAVDEAVERIVDRLEAVGVLDDTVIVFTADQGLFHGEHRIPGGKYLPYEPSLRVPLLVRGPMVPEHLRGTEVDEPVVNVDLAPTFMDLGGAVPLRPPDGRSLRPLLEGTGAPWSTEGGPWRPSAGRVRPVYVMGVGGFSNRFPNVTYSGVRSGDGYLYLRWENAARSVELYDLDADPHQLQNLAQRADHASVRNRLERQRRLLVRCRGQSCDVPPFGYLDLPRVGGRPAWYSAAVWADTNELGAATAIGTFVPQRAVTRGEMASWLWRRAGATDVAQPHGLEDVPSHLDAAVRWIVDAGVATGFADSSFRPRAPLARAELVTWLYRHAGSPPVPVGSPVPPDVKPWFRAAAAWALTDWDPGGTETPVLRVPPRSRFVGVTSTRAEALRSLWHLDRHLT